MKGNALAQWEIIGNIHRKFFKIFSRTNRPISIKLGINHHWVRGLLNCSNKGPGPLQREIVAKMG
jgi:hypothetical protein